MKPFIIDGVVFIQADDGRLIEVGTPETSRLTLEEARANANPTTDLTPQPVGDEVLEGVEPPKAPPSKEPSNISSMLGGGALRDRTYHTNTEIGAAMEGARPKGIEAINSFHFKDPKGEAKSWQAELSGQPVRKQLAAVAGRQFEDDEE